jgi:tRNA modification GTPase
MGRGEGELIESVPATRAPTLLVWNKADLHPTPPGPGWIAVSCLTGQGLDALVEAIRSALSTLAWTGPSPPPSRARHRAELESCMAALARARSAPSPELMAEDLRLAARSLGRLTGRIDVSDVLDAIFAEFCIGK